MALIIYDLECEYSHRFEGWFRSSDDFDEQRQAQLLCCPQCGTHSVRKVPSKLNIGSAAKEAPQPSQQLPSSDPNQMDVATAFVMARQAVQALISHSEDVGSDFAEEARRIHYNEAPTRAIRGQASPQEFEALRDEGIDVIALPGFPVEDELN